MNAPIRSAIFCLACQLAIPLASAGFAPEPSPNANFGIAAGEFEIAQETGDTSAPMSATPEAATMLLCGAGILVISAGMGLRRSGARGAADRRRERS